MRPLSTSTKKNILELCRKGYSTRNIAEKCRVSNAIVQKLRKNHVPDLKVSRGGRVQKLSPQDKRFCIRAITSGKLETTTAVARKLQEDVGIKVSARTVGRVLQEAGMGAAEKKEKPKLSIRNIKARLDFARRHKHWTIADWKRVIWSDETKINRFCSDGRAWYWDERAWYWKRDGESEQCRHVKETVKHGGGSIMIWGCMTAEGPGNMCKINGNMDQDLYRSILEEELEGTIDWYNMDVNQVIFQQDNDSKHKAKSVQAWLNAQPFEVLEWPAQSPDLNPIEHL
jgi:transposase